MTADQELQVRALLKANALDFEDVLDLAEEITGNSVVDLKQLDTQETSLLIEHLRS